LIRRNLRLKRNHIIEGASALRDIDAIPILREMLREETDTSRRLTLAGALWKINRDPAFIECLEEAKSKHSDIFQGVHLWQVLWLDDERALDFLIDLLNTKGIDLLNAKEWMTQSFTLGLLNQLEFGIPATRMPHQPADYRKLRADPAFRAHMVAAIHKRNAESKNGW
jgi:hypothetical protein